MALRDLRRPTAGVRPADGTDSGTAPTRTPGRTDDPEVLAASRRRFLRRAAAGSAALGASAVALATNAPAALAQTTGSTPGSSPGTTAAAAASASGKKPSVEGADLELGRFLHSVELTLIEVYRTAIDGGRLRSTALDLANTFQEHHRLQAAKLVDIVQSDAASGPNAGLLQTLQPRVANAATDKDVIAALESIEESAAATYQWAVGQAKDWQFVSTLASITPVDGQHAVAWSQKTAADLEAWVGEFDQAVPVVQGTEGRWDPAQYPVR